MTDAGMPLRRDWAAIAGSWSARRRRLYAPVSGSVTAHRERSVSSASTVACALHADQQQRGREEGERADGASVPGQRPDGDEQGHGRQQAQGERTRRAHVRVGRLGQVIDLAPAHGHDDERALGEQPDPRGRHAQAGDAGLVGGDGQGHVRHERDRGDQAPSQPAVGRRAPPGDHAGEDRRASADDAEVGRGRGRVQDVVPAGDHQLPCHDRERDRDHRAVDRPGQAPPAAVVRVQQQAGRRAHHRRASPQEVGRGRVAGRLAIGEGDEQRGARHAPAGEQAGDAREGRTLGAAAPAGGHQAGDDAADIQQQHRRRPEPQCGGGRRQQRGGEDGHRQGGGRARDRRDGATGEGRPRPCGRRGGCPRTVRAAHQAHPGDVAARAPGTTLTPAAGSPRRRRSTAPRHRSRRARGPGRS